jgi:hypothetical protein
MASQRLVPMELPWWIGPSSGGILAMIPEEDDGDAVILLSAYFIGTADKSIEESDPAPSFERGKFPQHLRRLEVRFPACVWFRMRLFRGDTTAFEPSEFEEDPTSEELPDGVGIDEWAASRNEEWFNSGLHPDPGVYIVENSLQVDPASLEFGLRHYILLGHHTVFELVAKEPSWLEIRARRS